MTSTTYQEACEALCEIQKTIVDACNALREIQKIVHIPTSKTAHRRPEDHYQSDFDQIRAICERVIGGPKQ